MALSAMLSQRTSCTRRRLPCITPWRQGVARGIRPPSRERLRIRHFLLLPPTILIAALLAARRSSHGDFWPPRAPQSTWKRMPKDLPGRNSRGRRRVRGSRRRNLRFSLKQSSTRKPTSGSRTSRNTEASARPHLLLSYRASQRASGPHHQNSEEIMKAKILVLFSAVVMALALMAQSTTQTAPAPSGDNAKACACCNHGTADGKMACGKDSHCCGKSGSSCKGGKCCQGKDGKDCPMMSKDGSGKMSCCAGNKCPMMSKEKGKSCCGGKMCQRPQAAA